MDSVSTSDALATAAKLDHLAKNVPQEEAPRKKLFEAARKLTVALETPSETTQRFAYMVVQTSIMRLCIDLNLFALLSQHDGPQISTTDLAKATKADPLLMKRVLQYLASIDMIDEVGEDKYSASNVTRALSVPSNVAGMHHMYDILGLAWHDLPKFLADTQYQNPMSPTHTPFHVQANTDKPFFAWLQSNPTNLASFNLWMTAAHAGGRIWLDVFPFEQEFGLDSRSDTILFVDVGGGIGDQCQALKKRFPSLPGRVILQDLPETLDQALPTPGVELRPHNFWTPQPVKGARAYYMRFIMHDYPDEMCVKILHHLKAAMDPRSVVLIDDMILPNKGAHRFATQIDMVMLSCLGSMERNQSQWQALLDSAGFQIRKIYTYNEEAGDSVIVAMPK